MSKWTELSLLLCLLSHLCLISRTGRASASESSNAHLPPNDSTRTSRVFAKYGPPDAIFCCHQENARESFADLIGGSGLVHSCPSLHYTLTVNQLCFNIYGAAMLNAYMEMSKRLGASEDCNEELVSGLQSACVVDDVMEVSASHSSANDKAMPIPKHVSHKINILPHLDGTPDVVFCCLDESPEITLEQVRHFSDDHSCHMLQFTTTQHQLCFSIFDGTLYERYKEMNNLIGASKYCDDHLITGLKDICLRLGASNERFETKDSEDHPLLAMASISESNDVEKPTVAKSSTYVPGSADSEGSFAEDVPISDSEPLSEGDVEGDAESHSEGDDAEETNNNVHSDNDAEGGSEGEAQGDAEWGGEGEAEGKYAGEPGVEGELEPEGEDSYGSEGESEWQPEGEDSYGSEGESEWQPEGEDSYGPGGEGESQSEGEGGAEWSNDGTPEGSSEEGGYGEAEGNSEGEGEGEGEAIAELSEEQTRIIITLLALTMAAILVLNTTILATILKYKELRTQHNMFIVSLASADICVGVFVIPGLMSGYFDESYMSTAVCRLCHYAAYTSTAASMFTVSAIASDRFRSVVFPLKPKLGHTGVTCAILVVWTLAGLYGIRVPAVFSLHVEEFLDDGVLSRVMTCNVERENISLNRILFTLDFFIVFAIPGLCMVFCYVGISYTISKKTIETNNEKERLRKTRKIIRILVILTTSFFILHLPLHIFRLYLFWVNTYFPNAQDILSYLELLSFANSLMNPLLYGLYNGELRKGCIKLYGLEGVLIKSAICKRVCFGNRVEAEKVTNVAAASKTISN